MHTRPLNFANPIVRNATTLLVLVGICASALPIPVGRINRDSKDLSQPFPCQHCPCGCKNAHQCWTKCCCYTPAQKAKWAKENGVTPPSYAVLSDSQSSDDKNGQGEVATKKISSSSEKGSTSKPIGKTLDAKKPTCPKCLAAKSCEPYDDDQDSPESPECKRSSQSVIVLSMMASKCSGQANVFSLLPWAILVTQPDHAQHWDMCGSQPSDNSFIPIQVFLFPDVPPPRALG